jgi:hypothetical protein
VPVSENWGNGGDKASFLLVLETSDVVLTNVPAASIVSTIPPLTLFFEKAVATCYLQALVRRVSCPGIGVDHMNDKLYKPIAVLVFLVKMSASRGFSIWRINRLLVNGAVSLTRSSGFLVVCFCSGDRLQGPICRLLIVVRTFAISMLSFGDRICASRRELIKILHNMTRHYVFHTQWGKLHFIGLKRSATLRESSLIWSSIVAKKPCPQDILDFPSRAVDTNSDPL